MAGQSTKSTLWRVVVAIAAALGASNAWGLGDEPRPGETVTQYLTPEILEALFPGADKVGEVGGTPPAASVSKGGHQLGYLFSTWDVTQSKGFSNRALILLVGVDLTGPRHRGTTRSSHGADRHPRHQGRTVPSLRRQLQGARSQRRRRHRQRAVVLGSRPGSFSQRSAPGSSAAVKVDAVSRATTSSVLMSDAIVRGGRIVARSRGNTRRSKDEHRARHRSFYARRLDATRDDRRDRPPTCRLRRASRQALGQSRRSR